MPTITTIRHVACEGPAALELILAPLGFRFEVHRMDAGDPVPSACADGLVVLGGPQAVYDPAGFPTRDAEATLIRRALSEGKPVLGVCLGSQLLAHAAGAAVRAGRVGPEIGWGPVHLTAEGTADPLFQGLPPEIPAFHWHSDTFDLPEGAVRLAGSAAYPHQAFRLGTSAYGFQFHLEVTEGMIREWMEAYASSLTPGGGTVPPERITERIEERAKELRRIAEAVFPRWASLLR